MKYRCRVCAYDQMPYPPKDYNICPCCGIEYGLDNQFESYQNLRDRWLLDGGAWFSNVEPFRMPPHWDAWSQLDLAEYPYRVPRPNIGVTTQSYSVRLPLKVRPLSPTLQWMAA